MLPHLLKAWSLDEWGMPTASTGVSTSSGADFSLIFSPSTATPPGKKKERLTGLFKNSEAWTQATWLKSPFWFKQSLVKFSSGLDAVVFIHWL